MIYENMQSLPPRQTVFGAIQAHIGTKGRCLYRYIDGRCLYFALYENRSIVTCFYSIFRVHRHKEYTGPHESISLGI